MIHSKEELEEKLKKVKKTKIEIGHENERPITFRHDILIGGNIKLDKSYSYIINLDNFLFRINIYEKDNILFHDGRISHTIKDFDCPFCQKETFRGSRCEVISKHLDEFLNLICTKHPSTRAKFVTGSVFQGKKVFSIPNAFEQMPSLQYKK